MLTFLALCVGENGKLEIREAPRLVGTNKSLNDLESTFFLYEREKIWGFENRKRGYRPIVKEVGKFLDHNETEGVTILGVFIQEDSDHIEKLVLYCHHRAELRELRRQSRQKRPDERAASGVG